jgi:hypothetical protein
MRLKDVGLALLALGAVLQARAWFRNRRRRHEAMGYDKDEAQRQLVRDWSVGDAPKTYRGFPVLAVSLFESTGDAMITYGDEVRGFFTGPLRGGPLCDLETLESARHKMDDTPGVPTPGSEYRHFKGGLYTVIASSIHELTGAVLVTYRSNALGGCWTRTLEDFGGGVPRFTHQTRKWPAPNPVTGPGPEPPA